MVKNNVHVWRTVLLGYCQGAAGLCCWLVHYYDGQLAYSGFIIPKKEYKSYNYFGCLPADLVLYKLGDVVILC